MCLLICAKNTHTNYPLILIANRDEYYHRPALAAQYWSENENILAGKDLSDGGSWLGITRQGRIAAITNYRNPSENIPNATSRGSLVRGFLQGDSPAFSYLSNIKNSDIPYNGFNLITGNINELWCLSHPTKAIEPIEEGIQGLSNARLNTPWPKVTDGKEALQNLITINQSCNEKLNHRELLGILNKRNVAQDQYLPDTGVGIESERALSPSFVLLPGYGTRVSTALTVDHNGNVEFTEITWNQNGEQEKQVSFEFSI
ncbi:MAG: hypothetical protein COA99_16630 [Moraxellaceae bacterium]|nr:MAG: hypothetical protein COA99_16630 [Moraxellaceae bacterium]